MPAKDQGSDPGLQRTAGRMMKPQTTGHSGIMRTILFLLLLIGLTLPACAADPSSREAVTVGQLEQIVFTGRISDHDLAQRLSRLELTERLNRERRTRLDASLPGEHARAALAVVADLSQFLNPPAGEILPTSPPDAGQRVKIFDRAVAYVHTALKNMPNFIATRETTRFESRGRLRDSRGTIAVQETPFRSTDHVRATVLYRDGAEVVETKSSRQRGKGLTSWGEFGPFLGMIAADMLKGTVTFHHWERSPSGPLAVFDYRVPMDHSSYYVRFCCNLHYDSKRGKNEQSFEFFPAYHGRIAIDPSSGAILRLIVSPELQPENGISRADVAIDYGSVELGGKSYICPLASVAVSVAPTSGQAAASLSNPAAVSGRMDAIGTTALNHTVFEDYHIFRADVRIVSEKEASAPAQPQER